MVTSLLRHTLGVVSLLRRISSEAVTCLPHSVWLYLSCDGSSISLVDLR